MTPDERMTLRTATCVHEAGHTTANFVLGLAFLKVRITSDVSGYVRHGDERTGSPCNEAVSYAAGYAAEVYWLRKHGHPEWMIDAAHPAAGHDRDAARHFAREAGLSLSTINSEANRLVIASWAPLWRTATALLKSPVLSYARTRRVARV